MKYLLFILLVCLAALEYWHHLSHGPASGAATYAASRAAPESAGDKLRQHLHHH